MFSRPLFKNPPLPPTPPLRFPQKLFKIANECQTGAVCWSPDGKSILLRYSLFREEFMSIKSDFFKTDNISSFVRQLNLYGFRKVYDHAHKHTYKANPDLHEFSNVFFQRDRPDLLDKVTRKSVMKERNETVLEHKSMEFLEESPNDNCDIRDLSTEDHSYMILSTGLPPPQPPESKPEVVVKVEKYPEFEEPALDSSANKENIAPKVPSAPERVGEVPVKKKRGRKPGSKSKKTPTSGRFPNNLPKTHYCPSLKKPEKCPELLYFKDDDDSVFLRNTSKDVMMSSTLPFHETAEYRALKEEYLRQCDMKMKSIRYFEKALRSFT